jgi:basic membrane protein A and related proteins
VFIDKQKRSYMKSKLLAIATIICLLSITFITPSCNLNTEASGDRGKIRVGIVFDIGGKDDRSFNAAAWVGVRRAEKNWEYFCAM